MNNDSQQRDPSGSWKDIVSLKRTQRDAELRKHASQSSPSNTSKMITDIAEVTELTRLTGLHRISAGAVVLAYIERACEAQAKTNCLTEICFDDAVSQARALDAYQEQHGRLKGPLHGVPVSLKDQFNIKGHDTTLGYVGRCFRPASEDALLVKVLKSLGAIIPAKTNLCQSIMWQETDNPLWGLTTHPTNPAFTPGGSSGGEGALLAMQGSMFGLGTDIGGSIRIPSHINGLWGLKPSSGRMSYQGVEVSTDGQQHVPSAVGPMTRSLDTLTVVTKALLGSELWTMDAQVVPIPWRDDMFEEFSTRKLVVGCMLDDGLVRVHPPIERVFRDTVSKLQAAGHEIVEWDSTLNGECIAVMDQYYTADGGEDIRRAISEGGEPFIPHVQALVDRAPAISVYQYWQLNKRKVALQQAYLKMWNSKQGKTGSPVDVLLIPSAPHMAVPHRTARWVGYTKLFNFLDYTALNFPAGKAVAAFDPEVSSEPRNTIDEWNWKLYNVETMNGLDIGLQLVGRRYEEEKVLGVASQVQKLLGTK